MKTKFAPTPPKYVDAHEPPRRHRTRAQPIGEPAQLTPRLMRVLQLLRHVHVADTDLMFRAWRGNEGGSEQYFRNLMTRVNHELLKLPHGQFTKTPVVYRPGDLNPDKGVKHQPAWYALTLAGQALAQEGHGIALPAKADPWHHRAMSGSVTSSLRLLAPDYGLEYGTLEDILMRQNCPEETRLSARPLTIRLAEGRWFEPDDIGRIKYNRPDDTPVFRYFGREEDRASKHFARLAEQIKNHLDFIDRGLFNTHFGIGNYRVLLTTTAPGRLRSIRDFLKGRKHGEKVLFKALPQFSTDHWDAPRAPLRAIYEPWESIEGSFDITRL
jgi:hypothetical protein